MLEIVEVLTSRSPSRFLDREAAYIGTQLVQGLAFLHGQGELSNERVHCLFDSSALKGVIHRDLKLENVLVASQRRSYTNGPMLYNVTGQSSIAIMCTCLLHPAAQAFNEPIRRGQNHGLRAVESLCCLAVGHPVQQHLVGLEWN